MRDIERSPRGPLIKRNVNEDQVRANWGMSTIADCEPYYGDKVRSPGMTIEFLTLLYLSLRIFDAKMVGYS